MDGSYQKMFKPDDTLEKSVLKKKHTETWQPNCHGNRLGVTMSQ